MNSLYQLHNVQIAHSSAAQTMNTVTMSVVMVTCITSTVVTTVNSMVVVMRHNMVTVCANAMMRRTIMR